MLFNDCKSRQYLKIIMLSLFKDNKASSSEEKKVATKADSNETPIER